MKKKDQAEAVPRGRVDARFNPERGKYRFRFHGVAPDQAESILAALQHARAEFGTDFDTVALDAICMHYLASVSPPRST